MTQFPLIENFSMPDGFFEMHDKLKRRKSAPPELPPDSRAIFTVTQITGLIERAIKAGVPPALAVRGEVSNFSPHRASGHLYFTLKDASATLDCVMFHDSAAKLKFQPSDGMELIATGRIGVYGQRGKYQLYVSTLQPIGQGALELAFQQLRAKLEKEGLFAPERKKPLPDYPLRIALITGRATAALADLLKVLRRFSFLRLHVYDVPTQGDGAAEKIAAALEHLNQRHRQIGGIDAIVLARGGGSLEDLWEFNEEIVARAIAASKIPVLTGIGHEVDVSIADLVADYHAHTPTEAAQVITANWKTARETIDASGIRRRREMRNLIQDRRQRLLAIERHEIFRKPTDRLDSLRQLLDDRQRALTSAGRQRLHAAAMRLSNLSAKLRERHPRHLVELKRQRLDQLQKELRRAVGQDLRRLRQRVDDLDGRLQGVGPRQVLKRGYTITTLKKTGAILRAPGQAPEGARLITQLADGEVESIVQDSRQLPLFE
jgi:exodeoxyribonuclease VII large subunit